MRAREKERMAFQGWSACTVHNINYKLILGNQVERRRSGENSNKATFCQSRATKKFKRAEI